MLTIICQNYPLTYESIGYRSNAMRTGILQRQLTDSVIY